MTSMTQEVMGQTAACDTPQEVWSLLEQTYASQSRARTVNTRIALAITQKDDMSISEYITKMKSLADEMAYAKKKVNDEELVSYILEGLDEEYNPVVSSLLARVEPVSVAEAHS
jgi:glutathionylspermidine synthase